MSAVEIDNVHSLFQIGTDSIIHQMFPKYRLINLDKILIKQSYKHRIDFHYKYDVEICIYNDDNDDTKCIRFIAETSLIKKPTSHLSHKLLGDIYIVSENQPSSKAIV